MSTEWEMHDDLGSFVTFVSRKTQCVQTFGKDSTISFLMWALVGPTNAVGTCVDGQTADSFTHADAKQMWLDGRISSTGMHQIHPTWHRFAHHPLVSKSMPTESQWTDVRINLDARNSFTIFPETFEAFSNG